MASEWNYNGDVNIRYGGYFWKEDGSDDYVLAVRITPCSDAGGPDNQFWIEQGSIFLGDSARQVDSLDVIGVSVSEATRRDYVDAALACHGIERDSWNGEQTLQIGAKAGDASHGWRGFTDGPDIILRGNAKLRRFIEREYLS